MMRISLITWGYCNRQLMKVTLIQKWSNFIHYSITELLFTNILRGTPPHSSYRSSNSYVVSEKSGEFRFRFCSSSWL